MFQIRAWVFLWCSIGLLNWGVFASEKENKTWVDSLLRISNTENLDSQQVGIEHALHQIQVETTKKYLDSIINTKLKKQFPLPQKINREFLLNIHEALEKEFLNLGYPFAQIRMMLLAEKGATSKEYTLQVNVLTDEIYVLGGVSYSGAKSSTDLLNRLAGWQVGLHFHPDISEKISKRLLKTGYFDFVEYVGISRQIGRELLWLNYRVKEARQNKVAGLLGYGSNAEAGWNGFMQVALYNFLESARDLRFELNRDKNSTEGQVFFKNPWWGPIDISTELTGNLELRDSVYQELGARVGFYRNLEALTMGLLFGWENTREKGAGTMTQKGKSTYTGLEFRMENRKLKKWRGRGLQVNLSIEGWDKELNSSQYYLMKSHHQIGGWWSPGFWGFSSQFLSSGSWPFRETLQSRADLNPLGGIYTLRGYPEKFWQTPFYQIWRKEVYRLGVGDSRYFAFSDLGWVNREVSRFDGKYVWGYGSGLELSQGDWNFQWILASHPGREFSESLLHVRVENTF